ncbi:MAG: enodribonuclease L-PSP [Betaproteobacteria bacterium RIFCSPLOWO2_12_FULL_67_28]|nr:MAG: enodribonuclease L-PSP [Betaproteobacteria bacterium RIFCSPLOWO2_12_FULL_67_28]
MADITILNVEALGKPLGQYSHLTRVKNAAETIYIAGMLAPGDGFDAQCSGAFAQIGKALASAGANWRNVVQFTTYLVHSQDIPKFMAWRLREFPQLFPDGKYPPNTLLVIDRLVGEPYLIEVQTIAAL